jgi:hypothetical protein
MAAIATEALAAATAMEAVTALILATAEAGRPPRVSALAAASWRWATEVLTVGRVPLSSRKSKSRRELTICDVRL